MPDNSANLAAMDASGHKIHVYAAFLTGTKVAGGSVTVTPTYGTNDGAKSVAVSYSLGSSSDVARGFRVVFKTAGGLFKGATGVRAGGTFNSTTLPIHELGKGTINIVSGDLFEVWNVIQPGSKLVEADENFRPDGLAYSSQNNVVPPWACSGGHFAAFVDTGEAYATIAFKGDYSYAVDVGSGGTLTHSWVAATATGTTTSTSANPSFTFPVGQHTVVHTVTDSSNSATWTQYVHGEVFDEDNLPYDLKAGSFSLGWDDKGAGSATLPVWDTLDLDAVPDGTLTLLFVREWINGVEQSFRGRWSGRRNIVFAGYLTNDDSDGDAQQDRLSLNAVDPMTYYQRVLGLSKVGTNASSSFDAWSKVESLSVKRMALIIPRWYSWLSESWDLTVHASFSDALYPQFFINKQDPISQTQELADGRDARLTCDRSGHFELQPVLEYTALAARSGYPTTLTFNDDRVISYRIVRNHQRPLEYYRQRGFTAGASGNTPLFAKWPGGAPGDGIENGTTDKVIADNVQENYIRCGRRGAKADRIYQMASDGALHHAPTLEITTFGSYDVIDTAFAEWQQFASGSLSNLRDIDVSLFRWIARRVDWEFREQNGGSALYLNYTFDAETHGEPGVDDTPPPESSTGFDPGNWTPPDWSFPPYTGTVPDVPVAGGLVPGLKRLARIMSNGHLRRTTNFERSSALGGPSWDDVDLSGTIGTTVLQWCYDARSNASGTHGWVLTPTAIYKINNVWGTPTATLQNTFGVASSYRNIDFDYILQPGLFGMVASSYTDGVRVTASRDGTTWGSEVSLGGGNVSTSVPAAQISARVAGKAWSWVWDPAFSASVHPMKVTTDYGVNWPGVSNILDDDALGTGLVVPYADASETIAYHGILSLANVEISGYPADSNNVVRGTINTGQVDITPIVSSVRYGPDFGRGRFTMSASPSNKGRLLVCGTNYNQSLRAVFLITNADTAASAGAVTMNTIVAPGAGVNYTRCALVSDNEFYIFGLNGAIAYSADGATIDDRIGNGADTAEVVGVTG